MQNNDIQVPVINKTKSCFYRETPQDEYKMDSRFLHLVANEDYIATLKTDGTCALVCKENDKYWFLKRQDIKQKSRNYKTVIERAKLSSFGGTKCLVSTYVRGTGKQEMNSLIYIFNLDENDEPLMEYGHIVGFTPVSDTLGEDKYLATAMIGLNGSEELSLYCTEPKDDHTSILVKRMDCAKILKNNNMLTVEIMGKKIADRYVFDHPTHFINIHGSIIISETYHPKFTKEGFSEWALDENNIYKDNEGIVFHFPKLNTRYKFHMGHINMMDKWRNDKSNIRFVSE